MTENKVCPVGTKVQSLIFSKENYTENSAKKWAKGHDYKFEYVDEKEQTFRIRQKNPKYFDTDSFRTIDITDGIQAVIGCPKIKMENGGEFVFITDRQINDECILELVELIRSEKSISSWFIDKINFNLVIVFDKEIIIDDISKFKDLVLKFDICHDVIKPEINIENNKEKKVIFIPLITDDISVGEFEDGGSVGNIKPIFDLQKKVTGSLFKGENWEYFVNQIPEYFLKTFNAPLGLENRSNVLSENFTSYYGEKDIEIFLLHYKKYPNATTFIKAGGYTTKLPKFASDYLYDILNKNNETLQGSKEEESIIENVSENKVNEFGIIANVNTLNITTEKGRFGVTTYPKAFEQLKEYRDSYNNQYKIKVSLNPLVMPTEDANTIYRKLKKYANDYDFDISVNLIENDKGEIEDIEYPEGKSYIYLINRNYKKNNTDKMENKYDYNNLIKVDDVKIIDTYEGDDVKRISFIWNDNFYKWRYRFSKTSSSLNIIKYPSLIDLENSNTFGKSHNQGIIIYNTFNSEQTTDEGTYIEFSISKWDKKNIFSKSGETLQGGKADKLTVEDIAKKHNVSIEYANEQLNKGIKIESEHTDDIEKQREIALDHLSEFIEYYSKLEKMEEEMKKENLQENKYITNEMEQPKLEINSTTVKNWSEIPTIWKNTNKVKKINFINSPYNKELIRLVTPFAGNDVLRPVFSGINFDKNGITVTDAYKLITLPYPNKDYDGTYATISKTATKSANLNKDLFTEKYPNYENLIPSENKIENTFNISVYKLLQYVNVALHYNDSITNNINFAVGNKKVGLNGNYLKQVLEAILKLGYENIYVHFKSDTKTSPVLFTPENKFKLGEDTIIILMPIFIKDDETLGASDIDFERYLLVYYDFSKDQVINEDGSIAEFKMNYGEYDIISDNEINLIESITKSNKSIPISEYFKVDNGKILFTNFQSFVSIKNENLKNGLYKVIDNAIEYDSSFSLGNFDEFPVVDNVENIKIKFIISSDVLKHYLKSAFDFVGNDDLRPIMNGVLFDYRNKNMFIVSTNAHYLYRVNITKFIEINNIEEDFQFIVNEDLIKFLENIEESVLTVSASNNGGYVGNHFIVENENCKIVSRQIDGKYPNYLAVIPIKSDKKLTLNIKKIFECLKDKETVNYIKENKKNDIKIYDVVKNTSEVEMRLYYNERGDYLPHNEIKICDLEYQLENGEFYSKDDLILLMGVKNDTKSNNNFSFTLEFFQTVLENLNCKDLEILFSEKNRGYVFSGDCFGYESTIKYKKDKPKIELSNQQKEIKDAIETLTALTSLGGDENEVKEWNDAIETLKMLLEEDIKKFDDGGLVFGDSGFTISEIKNYLNEKFPDSFGFTVNTPEPNTRPDFDLIPNKKEPFKGLTDSEIKSKLYFPKYKREHEINYRVNQGMENTYFYFYLNDENGNPYIGQFGFKDRGDVPDNYITKFIAFLMKEYELPFQVTHDIYKYGGEMKQYKMEEGGAVNFVPITTPL